MELWSYYGRGIVLLCGLEGTRRFTCANFFVTRVVAYCTSRVHHYVFFQSLLLNSGLYAEVV